MNKDLMNDGNRLLGATDARGYLKNMPKTTFYRNIQRGVIPKPRYMGKTPVWRLADLQGIYDQLPDKPLIEDSLSASR